MNRSTWRTLYLFIFSLIPATGEKIHDYAQAFDQLIELGLPDAQGAQYVQLKLAEENSYSSYQRYSLPSKGNAWLMPGDEAAPQFIYQGTQLQKISKQKKKGVLAKLLFGSKKKDKSEFPKGEWKPVSPEQDFEKIEAYLAKLIEDGNVFAADRWSYDDSGVKLLAKLLIKATHLHRSGHQDLGNRLASRIFEIAPTPPQVIDVVVDQLATQEYGAVFETFLKEQNWKNYFTQCEALLKKFPRGWKTAAGLKILLPKVEKMTLSPPAEIQSFKNLPLHPKITQTFADFSTRSEPIQISLPVCWLISSSEKSPPRSRRGSQESASWLKEILALEMEAFPTLISLAADETLLPSTSAESDSHSSNPYYFRGSDELPLGEIYYRSMKRPCTRGEIARAILSKSLPDDGELSNASPKEFQEIAYHWWKKNRNASKREIAEIFLNSQNEAQSHIALDFLIHSGAEEDFKTIEDFFLNAEIPENHTHSVGKYLKIRKAKAKPFFEKYAEILRAGSSENDSFVTQSYDGTESNGLSRAELEIKKLALLVEEASSEKIIAQIRSAKITVKDGLTLLKSTIDEGEAHHLLPALISMIAALPQEKDRFIAMGEVSEWLLDDYRRLEGEEQISSYCDALEKSIPSSQKDWETFFARKKSPTVKSSMLSRYGSPPSEAHYAAWLFQRLYFPKREQTIQKFYSLISLSEMWDFLLTHSQAVLSQGPDAPFPSKEKVSDERKEEIRKQLSSMTVSEIMAFHRSASMSEKLAWQDILTGFEGETPETILSLANLCYRISWRHPEKFSESTRKKLETLLIAKPLTSATITETFSYLGSLAQTHPGLIIMLTPSHHSYQGVSCYAWIGSLSDQWIMRTFNDEAQKLSAEKTPHFNGIYLYRAGEDSSTPEKAVLFAPPFDEQSEKDAVKKITELGAQIFKEAPETRSHQSLTLLNLSHEILTQTEEE